MGRYGRLKQRLRGMRRARGHVDANAGNRIAGWAFADGAAVRVEAAVGGTVLASAVPALFRNDIAQAFPGQARAGMSGFVLDLPAAALPLDDMFEVTVTARLETRFYRPRTLATLAMASPNAIAKVANPPETQIVGPFPKPVIDTVCALSPGICHDLSSRSGQSAFVDGLRAILRTPALRSAPAIADYVRYLQAVWTHCRFVDDFFPAVNATAKEDATDFHCKPNSIHELFPIAHQLYVLKSYGVPGDFAEFGCFKGFSSAMLSFACRQLGLRMHIFDSFEGLPPAEGSGYQAGEYAGSLEEVTANVTRFGAIETVEFHKGFFSDTFARYRPPPLMALWMDVDLELSSRDLMVVADHLDPRSTVFSHECSADMFADGVIVNAPQPDNPIPPLLDRFEAMERPLTGCFVRGSTGAFWPRRGGIPVLDQYVLMDLVQAVVN